MMTANDIGQQFVDFFCKKHLHKFAPSSSVAPPNAPSYGAKS
jgi:alanyl-tRNA synthetase